VLERQLGRKRAVAAGAAAQIEVFEHDIYTVVLTDNPLAIPAAMERVPEGKRVHVSADLMAFDSDSRPSTATLAVRPT
jgi:hypothetical protein